MNSCKSEINLFIIWEKARHKQNEIISDIDKQFEILGCFDVEWDENLFHENLTRFYGEKLPNGSHKEKHCGKGRFLLIIFNDLNPAYDFRATSRGPEYVNTRVFDKKSTYRDWTGGGHKIHGTNGIHETKHDLMLLLGKSVDDFLDETRLTKSSSIIRISKNLEGAKGWRDLEHMFSVLNETSEYVVMRNFSCLPHKFDQSLHGDIDFLVTNKIDFIYMLNARNIDRYRRPAGYIIDVAGDSVECDIRHIGDGYFDSTWQSNVLKCKKLKGNIYIPNNRDHVYSLLYHALIHKDSVSYDYIDLFKSNGIQESDHFSSLNEYMTQHNYSITIPDDSSVMYNFRNEKIMLQRGFELSKRNNHKALKHHFRQKIVLKLLLKLSYIKSKLLKSEK